MTDERRHSRKFSSEQQQRYLDNKPAEKPNSTTDEKQLQQNPRNNLKRDIRVDARNHVVHHDPEPAFQTLRLSRRRGLHYVEKPEQEKPDHHVREREGDEYHGNEVPAHLVRYDAPGVFLSEYPLGYTRRPYGKDYEQYRERDVQIIWKPGDYIVERHGGESPQRSGRVREIPDVEERGNELRDTLFHLRERPFHSEEVLFNVYTGGISAEPVRRKHPVAGDDYRYRIGPDGVRS